MPRIRTKTRGSFGRPASGDVSKAAWAALAESALINLSTTALKTPALSRSAAVRLGGVGNACRDDAQDSVKPSNAIHIVVALRNPILAAVRTTHLRTYDSPARSVRPS